MNVKDLSLDDMSADRSTSKSNPTQQLRDAIRNHEIVIEIVDTGEDERVYDCDISMESLKRDRKKQLENDLWQEKNLKLLKDQMESLGTHHHTNSDYIHEILVLDEYRTWKAMKRLIKDKKSTQIAKVLEDGWSPLHKEFEKKIKYDFWDLDSLNDARGNKYEIAEVCYEIVQYAMSHEIDPDTAITALELKKDENFGEKIKSAFVSSYNERKYELFKDAHQAEKEALSKK